MLKDGAKVFIKNKKLGKFLFFLRDDNQNIPNPNMWGLLGGGIEDRETPIEALKRELSEESNVEVYNIKNLGSILATNIFNEDGGKRVESNQVFVFLADTDAMLDQLKLYEGQKLGYFTLEQVKKQSNLSPGVREAIVEFKEQLS